MFKRFFPVGTRSLLWGVHHFLWHPVTVYIAWVKLYGWPTWKETVCIFIHDWGYWGKKNMDGEQGVTHPELGARIAGFLFGQAYYELVLYHSRKYAKRDGVKPSKLCWPDKLSLVYDPKFFYILRASLSGEIKEYRKIGARTISLEQKHSEWYDWLKGYLIKEVSEKAELYSHL